MLDHDVQRLALRIMRALDTPRSLSVAILIEAGEWDQVARMRILPANYEPRYFCGIEKYRRDVFATEFLRKHDSLPTTIDKAEVALTTFLETERQCFSTNLWLERFWDNPVLETALERAFAVKLDQARAWIGKTLGSLPDHLNGRFGPGATFESDEWRSASRKGITAITKLRKAPAQTSNVPLSLVDHLVWDTAFGKAWGECCPNRLFRHTRGNRFSTVPKDSTKDRGIAIEPGINVLGQLAVGGEMKNRLKRRGLDLKLGQQLHRRMAESASLTQSHATIDLSNASNTIASSLVRLLLPTDWYELLSSFRSENTFYTYPGEKRKRRWQRLEMFSSMGNGYTFELETLIFAALIHTCGGKIGVDSFVYGDDMIVPTGITADVLAVLRCAGFTPNEKKTFTSGSFRESCGGDFLHGHDVRPYQLKENPSESADWMVIANSLWSWSLKWDLPELLGARAFCIDQLPAAISACRGPETFGALLLWDHPERWTYRTRNSVRWFRVWRPVFRKNGFALRDGDQVIESSALKLASGFYHWLTSRVVRVSSITEIGVAIAALSLGIASDGLVPRGERGVDGYRFGRLSYS